MSPWVGSMRSGDGVWRVDVGGVGATKWYRLVGPGVDRSLPSTAALLQAAGECGVDLADLRDVKEGDSSG